MPGPVAEIRLRTCKVSRGRAHFNEVIMEQRPAPDFVVLAAVDVEVGLYVWVCSHEAVLHNSVPQHVGYSRSPRSFDVESPPEFLGEPDFFPSDAFEKDDWDALPKLQTNALNKRVRRMLQDVGLL